MLMKNAVGLDLLNKLNKKEAKTNIMGTLQALKAIAHRTQSFTTLPTQNVHNSLIHIKTIRADLCDIFVMCIQQKVLGI